MPCHPCDVPFGDGEQQNSVMLAQLWKPAAQRESRSTKTLPIAQTLPVQAYMLASQKCGHNASNDTRRRSESRHCLELTGAAACKEASATPTFTKLLLIVNISRACHRLPPGLLPAHVIGLPPLQQCVLKLLLVCLPCCSPRSSLSTHGYD